MPENFIQSLSQLVAKQSDQQELANFINDHLILSDDSLRIEYGDRDSVSWLELKADRAILGYGGRLRQTRIIVEQEEIWIELASGDRFKASEVYRLVQDAFRLVDD